MSVEAKSSPLDRNESADEDFRASGAQSKTGCVRTAACFFFAWAVHALSDSSRSDSSLIYDLRYNRRLHLNKPCRGCKHGSTTKRQFDNARHTNNNSHPARQPPLRTIPTKRARRRQYNRHQHARAAPARRHLERAELPAVAAAHERREERERALQGAGHALVN